MILEIGSSIATFKTIRFHEGLNVLLADTSPGASDKQTRNSAGKTSLIEIIHFIYGSDCDKDSLFRTEALIAHSFRATLSIQGEEFIVERTGSDPSKIYLLEGGDGHENLPVRIDKATELRVISNVNWRVFLGHALFSMPSDERGTIYEQAYTPTFRALFSYFARRHNSGGLISPERQAEKQQRPDWQVNLSYLLGLDWQIPFEFNKIRVREKSLEELKKAAKQGALGEVVGTVSQLRPQLTISEAKAKKLRGQLENFEVLDSYKSLSRSAAHAKSEMQAISRDSISLNENLDHLERSLETEKSPERADLRRLYAAAGVELPGVAMRRFDEVVKFYDSVVENRKTHLQQEISTLRNKLARDELRMATLDAERSGILRTLEGRGALDDFLELQRTLATAEADAASLRERFKVAGILEGESTQLVIDRVNLQRRLQEDHSSRQAALDEAILLIADAISELYKDRQGRFVVEATDNGPEFKISIEGDRGGGISNMEIFCLDLALFQIVTRRIGGPGFLIHDSHLFDGVDERQVARALLLGMRATSSGLLQYIVTMNSDIFDRLPLDREVDRSKVVLTVRLSDETETGGLFGFWFR